MTISVDKMAPRVRRFSFTVSSCRRQLVGGGGAGKARSTRARTWETRHQGRLEGAQWRQDGLCCAQGGDEGGDEGGESGVALPAAGRGTVGAPCLQC